MATAQTFIEGAYARSSANDPGKLATDGELLGVADRVYQALFAIAAAVAPQSYISKTTITLAGSVGTLPTDVIDIRRVQSAGGQKINVVPIEEIDRSWHLAPAIFRQGSSIVSRGNTGDPGAADTLTLWILDAPTNLVALATAIDARFPVRNYNLVIVHLALYLAIKDTGRNSAEYAALKEERDALMETFLRLSGLSLTALQTPHGGAIIQRFDALLQAERA